MWENALVPPDLNKTFIAFIHKINNADHITQFRPISLCNTIYKVFTKILANHIKHLLNTIISPTQAAFLPEERLAIQSLFRKFFTTSNLIRPNSPTLY